MPSCTTTGGGPDGHALFWVVGKLARKVTGVTAGATVDGGGAQYLRWRCVCSTRCLGQTPTCYPLVGQSFGIRLGLGLIRVGFGSIWVGLGLYVLGLKVGPEVLGSEPRVLDQVPFGFWAKGNGLGFIRFGLNSDLGFQVWVNLTRFQLGRRTKLPEL
ncbi:hypothetical protein ACFX2J_006786 [Malus domestica]